MSNYDFKKFEEDQLTKPRDTAWTNWAKFEKVGDSVQGFIRDVFFRASEGDFAEQRALTLEQPDGVLINVGIKHIPFVLAKTNNLRLGDPVTIVFEKELPPRVKGHSATKQMAFYGKELPENATQSTVAQLEIEDRNIAAASEEIDSEAVAEFNAHDSAQGEATPPEAPAEPEAPAAPAPAPAAPKSA